MIELVAAGGLNAQEVDAPEQLRQELTLYGATAASRTTINRYRDSARQRDICTMSRTMYLRDNGDWRAISHQESQLHDGPLAHDSYDSVIGKYQPGNGRPFTVTKVGRTLFAQLPVVGIPPVPLADAPSRRRRHQPTACITRRQY